MAQKLQAEDINDKMSYLKFWNTAASQSGVSPYWSQYANKGNLAPYWKAMEGQINPTTYVSSVEHKLRNYWNQIQSNQIPQTPNQVVIPTQDISFGRAYDSFIKSTGYSSTILHSLEPTSYQLGVDHTSYVKPSSYQTVVDHSVSKPSEYQSVINHSVANQNTPVAHQPAAGLSIIKPNGFHVAIDHSLVNPNGYHASIDHSYVKPSVYRSNYDDTLAKPNGYQLSIDHSNFKTISNPVVTNGYTWNSINSEPSNLIKSTYAFTIAHGDEKHH